MATDPLDTLPPVPAANDNGALRVVMERLGGMAAALVELKTLVQAMAARQQQDALERVAATATQEAKITAAHTRLDGHANEIKDLKAANAAAEKRLSVLEPAYRLMLFVGSALGISVIGLIWALITGTAKVTFGG